MSYKIVMKPISVIEADLKIEDNGEVEHFFASECAKEMDKFVPFDTGNLADYQIYNNNEIWYEVGYAEYQYNGERKDGSHKINPANRNRNYHPLATSFWDKYMWTANGQDIVKRVQEYVKKGGNK